MKANRYSRSLILALPVVSIIASLGIVVQQSMRRERLKRELATSAREITRLEARYRDLQPASGRNALAKLPLPGLHGHDHHDGDGD